jgi:hypothetical protein
MASAAQAFSVWPQFDAVEGYHPAAYIENPDGFGHPVHGRKSLSYFKVIHLGC